MSEVFVQSTMFRFKLSAVLISALLCSLLQAASYEALVTAARGNILELDAQQQVVRTLSINATVPEGHAIQTQAGATATIILANGGVLTVQPETTLVLEQMQLDGDPSMASYRPLRPSPANTRTRLRLDRGEVLGEIKGIRANSKFEVTSAVGTAGITGTQFVVSVQIVDGQYVMTISNLDGSVVATLAGTSPVSVPAGSQVTLSGTYDSVSGSIEDAASTGSTPIASSVLNNFSAIISAAVDAVGAEETGDPQTDFIPLGDTDLEPDSVSSSVGRIVGTPL